jgi:hypothetical protein
MAATFQQHITSMLFALSIVDQRKIAVGKSVIPMDEAMIALAAQTAYDHARDAARMLFRGRMR